jgi:Excreted virulence factor EspC, type VII ESX diderm
MPDVFFTVDPDRLDSLQGQLDHIGSGLQDIGQVARRYDPLELGPDAAVWDALEKFDGDWSAGIAMIQQNLTALEGLLGKAAAAYRGTDQQISQTAAQSGSPAR